MKRYLILCLILTAGLLVSCTGYDCFGPQGPGGWGPMMHYGFGYGGIFMWILFLVVAGLLIYFIVQGHEPKGPTAKQHENPLDILKKRYAKGEITKEEYDGIKKDLEG